MTDRHYLDPGPQPADLRPCICADWFAQGEAEHLPGCPRAVWTCACRYMNSGPICTHCGKLRPPAAPAGW